MAEKTWPFLITIQKSFKIIINHERLVLFSKIIKGLASVETEDILTPTDSRTRKNHSFNFKQKKIALAIVHPLV